MLTPQQIQEISFERAVFGGYDMDSVDDILEPLTEDYIALYKENSILKSKMRVLVEKLEEYRKQETSMQTAMVNAQKTCDQMTAEAQRKCAQMLREAEQQAAVKVSDESISQEQARLRAAKEATSNFMDDMEKRLKRQLEVMEELRKEHALPAPKPGAKLATEPRHAAYDFDADAARTKNEDALIQEIGQNIEQVMGTDRKELRTSSTTKKLNDVREAISSVKSAEGKK